MGTKPAMLGAAVIMLFLPNTALAVCTLGLSVHNINPSYDMFDNTELGIVAELEVTHNYGDSCSYFVTFSDGDATSYDRRMAKGGDFLSYQLYDTASKTNVLKDKIDATSNEVLSGTVTSEETSPENLTYYLAIPGHQIKPDGSYADTCTLTLYEGTLGGSNTEVDSQGVTITSILQKQLELCLLDAEGAFDPDDSVQALAFGVLTEGEALGFDTRVRSNAGYSMTMLSANEGKLKLVGQSAKPSTTVAYTLKVDTMTKDLSGTTPVQVATGSGQTAISGVAQHVTVTIGSVTGKAAGSYEDSITIAVSTTE